MVDLKVSKPIRHRTKQEIDAAIVMIVRASAEPLNEAQGRLLLEPLVDLLHERDALREALRDAVGEAHSYGLVRDHWKKNADDGGPFEECDNRDCIEARALLGLAETKADNLPDSRKEDE